MKTLPAGVRKQLFRLEKSINAYIHLKDLKSEEQVQVVDEQVIRSDGLNVKRIYDFFDISFED